MSDLNQRIDDAERLADSNHSSVDLNVVVKHTRTIRNSDGEIVGQVPSKGEDNPSNFQVTSEFQDGDRTVRVWKKKR